METATPGQTSSPARPPVDHQPAVASAETLEPTGVVMVAEGGVEGGVVVERREKEAAAEAQPAPEPQPSELGIFPCGIQFCCLSLLK